MAKARVERRKERARIRMKFARRVGTQVTKREIVEVQWVHALCSLAS